MFGEHGLDLFIGSEAAFLRRFETPINAGEFGRSCLILAGAQFLIDLKGKLSQHGLRVVWPGFDAFQRIFESFGCHSSKIASSGRPRQRCGMAAISSPHPAVLRTATLPHRGRDERAHPPSLRTTSSS